MEEIRGQAQNFWAKSILAGSKLSARPCSLKSLTFTACQGRWRLKKLPAGCDTAGSPTGSPRRVSKAHCGTKKWYSVQFLRRVYEREPTNPTALGGWIRGIFAAAAGLLQEGRGFGISRLMMPGGAWQAQTAAGQGAPRKPLLQAAPRVTCSRHAARHMLQHPKIRRALARSSW